MEWVLPMLADSMISDDDMMDDEGEDDMMDDLDMMNATMTFTLDPVTNSQTMHLSSTNETGDTLNLTILIDESQNLMSYSMVQSNATSEMHMSYAVMWGDAISITVDETLPRTAIPVHWDGLSMSGSDDGDGDEEMFLCDSGEEIPEDWVNDGEEDCYDGSDESEDDDNDPPTPEEAMDDVDANDDGYMSYQEFQDSWESENSELDWDEVATLFDDCDYDGNDLIDIDEMQYFIDGVVDMLIEDGDSDGSPEEWMDYIDADDDGYVSLQEFIDHINNDNDQNGEPPMTSEEEDGFTSVFDNVDSDDDGLLDFDEFIALLESFEDDDDGEMFLCDSGEEIPEDWVNDGEEDCSDGSDESVTVVVDNNNSVEEPRNLSLTVADNQTFEASLNDFAIQFLLCNSDERSECMVEAEASLYSLTGTIGNSSYVYGDLDMDGMISAGDTLEITDMDPNYEFDLYDSWSDSYVSESAVNGPNMPGFGGLLATISMLGAAFLLPRRDD
jgi:Ca2+-binding EF-hand superfamily protein